MELFVIYSTYQLQHVFWNCSPRIHEVTLWEWQYFHGFHSSTSPKADMHSWSNYSFSETRTAPSSRLCYTELYKLNSVVCYTNLPRIAIWSFVDLSQPGSLIREERKLQSVACYPNCFRCFAITSSTHGGDEKCIQNFSWKTWRIEITWETSL
jgi:hypothetical protein